MDTSVPVGDAKHDLLGRIDTQALYQPFLEKLNALLNACADRGWIYVVTGGGRSWEAQDALYAKGRTAPGGIVTNAKGGQSPHNFYVAVDFVRHKGDSYEGKLVPDYDDKSFAVLGEEAARLGLEWGGAWKSFKDTPHIQLPIKAKGYTWVQLAKILKKGGTAALFEELDKQSW